MRRIILFAFVLFLGILARPAWAGDDAGTKLGRGISNLAFGWFEIVNEMGQQADKHGIWAGVPAGLLRGTVFAAGRMLAGVYEVITFLLPNGERGYEPVVLPESVFARR